MELWRVSHASATQPSAATSRAVTFVQPARRGRTDKRRWTRDGRTAKARLLQNTYAERWCDKVHADMDDNAGRFKPGRLDDFGSPNCSNEDICSTNKILPIAGSDNLQPYPSVGAAFNLAFFGYVWVWGG